MVVATIAAMSISWGCSSVKKLHFTCSDPSVDMYVDNEYIGTSHITYAFPSGVQSVVVKGMSDGQEVFCRTICKDSWNNNDNIDFEPQHDYQYSSGGYKPKTR